MPPAPSPVTCKLCMHMDLLGEELIVFVGSPAATGRRPLLGPTDAAGDWLSGTVHVFKHGPHRRFIGWPPVNGILRQALPL